MIFNILIVQQTFRAEKKRTALEHHPKHVQNCLSKSPARQFQTCQEMSELFRRHSPWLLQTVCEQLEQADQASINEPNEDALDFVQTRLLSGCPSTMHVFWRSPTLTLKRICQLIEFSPTAEQQVLMEPESAKDVECELSDRRHFIRVYLTRKAVGSQK